LGYRYTFFDEDNQLARKISSSLLEAAFASAFSSIAKDEVDDGKVNHVFDKAGVGIEWDDSDDDEVPKISVRALDCACPLSNVNHVVPTVACIRLVP
jgi:hypothetical protein